MLKQVIVQQVRKAALAWCKRDLGGREISYTYYVTVKDELHLYIYIQYLDDAECCIIEFLTERWIRWFALASQVLANQAGARWQEQLQWEAQ